MYNPLTAFLKGANSPISLFIVSKTKIKGVGKSESQKDRKITAEYKSTLCPRQRGHNAPFLLCPKQTAPKCPKGTLMPNC